MISYEELDRALSRWKARAQGGVVESRSPESASVSSSAVRAVEGDATPLPIRAEDLGSIPNRISPPATERTGEIDLAEIESYEDDR